MTWYLEVLKKYAVFKGRARRKEYWYFVLFNTLLLVFLVLDSHPGENQHGSNPKAAIA